MSLADDAFRYRTAVIAGASAGIGAGFARHAAHERFGAVDLLVNNAGIMATGILPGDPGRALDAMLRANIGGCANGIRVSCRECWSAGAARSSRLEGPKGVTPPEIVAFNERLQERADEHRPEEHAERVFEKYVERKYWVIPQPEELFPALQPRTDRIPDRDEPRPAHHVRSCPGSGDR